MVGMFGSCLVLMFFRYCYLFLLNLESFWLIYWILIVFSMKIYSFCCYPKEVVSINMFTRSPLFSRFFYEFQDTHSNIIFDSSSKIFALFHNLISIGQTPLDIVDLDLIINNRPLSFFLFIFPQTILSPSGSNDKTLHFQKNYLLWKLPQILINFP